MKAPNPTPTKTQQLHTELGWLFSQSLQVSSPVQMLHIIREKIGRRDYQPFDKDDILKELGQLQKALWQIHHHMFQIEKILKQP